MRGFRVKPGREMSVLAAVVGVAMGLFGLIFLLPTYSTVGFGGVGAAGSAFVVLWVLVAFGIAGFYAYNALSDRGVSVVDVDITGTAEPPVRSDDFETRLRKLASLRRDGLITDDEYEEKRQEILAERW